MTASTMDVRGEPNLNADKSPQLIATTTTLLVLATIFVALRFLARRLSGLNYQLNDWSSVVALIATFATGAINYCMIEYGLGRHQAVLSMSTQETFFKLLLAFECVYVTGVALVKISLLLMYVRIFQTRSFIVSSWVIGATVVAWWLAICLVCIFQCDPIYRAWQPWVTLGHCIDLKASFIGNAVPNIVTDAVILCMPMYQVWKLQINAVQKTSLIGVFLLGTFVFFASIYRFTTIMQFDPMDTTWTLATACTWCVVEVAVGLICVCLPTLRPLFLRMSSRFGSSKDPNSRYNHSAKSDFTELVTIGGSGRPEHKFDRIIAAEDERYGTETYIGRDKGLAEEEIIESGGSGDEAPLRPGDTSSKVIYVNRNFEQTEMNDKNTGRTHAR